jgi:hypothetical protein
MTGFDALWLPILLSSAVVFVASSVIHMFTPWHKGDYPRLADEDRVMEALRPFALAPGDYMVPRPSSREEMSSPAFADKRSKGPVLVLTVLPNGPVTMGSSLAGWFVYLVVVGAFAGYVAGRALPPGAHYLHVFRFVGATAFASYTLALWQMTIWFKRGWLLTAKATIDGLLYASLTAGVFGWLWPR